MSQTLSVPQSTKEFGGIFSLKWKEKDSRWRASFYSTVFGPSGEGVPPAEAIGQLFLGERGKETAKELYKLYTELHALEEAATLEVHIGRFGSLPGVISQGPLWVCAYNEYHDKLLAHMDLRVMFFLTGRTDRERSEVVEEFQQTLGWGEHFAAGGEQRLANMLQKHIVVYDTYYLAPYHTLPDTRRDFYPQPE